VLRDRLFLRSPNLIAYWRNGHFVIEEFVRRRRIRAAPLVVQALDVFSVAQPANAAAERFPGFTASSVRREIGRLVRWGFLRPASANGACDVSAAWRGSFAAAHFHFAVRDLTYLREAEAQARYVRARFDSGPPPPVYRPRRGSVCVPLPTSAPVETTLHAALHGRRTTRQFSRRAVPFATFSRIVQGTWGQTGWLDGGLFGRLLAKTSPSAGARHPIECYVLAWRVAGLAPGLYHFDVQTASLERLRRGDFRQVAVALAAGQPWIRDAAFLCVMTAVSDRVFWKYASSDGYRLFLLDAGHLGQTFSLLATASGLGPFTTAALSERRIERLLGLDGIGEFPVYLCGAGVPPAPGSRAPRRLVSEVAGPVQDHAQRGGNARVRANAQEEATSVRRGVVQRRVARRRR
jgi:SagB-type dehydrogenase family enzyme